MFINNIDNMGRHPKGPDEPLTPKQKERAKEYALTGNGVRSAMKVYNTDYNTANTMASYNKSRPNVIGYLSTIIDKAGFVIEEIMDNKKNSPKVRLDSAIYIYDQVHGKAKQRIETSNVNVNINLDKLSDEELERLINEN